MADEPTKKPAAPKKEKEHRPSGTEASAKPANEKQVKSGEEKAAKPADEKAVKKPAPAAGAPAAPAAPAGDAAKPAEAPVVLTADELLGEDAAGKRIIKAKHAKNII